MATPEQPRKDTVPGMLGMAVVVSLVCSVVVTAVSVQLQPLQARNEAANRQQNILRVVDRLDPDRPIAEQFEAIDARLVNLESGAYVEDMDPANFDPLEAATEPDMSVSIPDERDIASIQRRARYGEVFLVPEDGEVRYIVLPVYGMGLWSTMYGFLALESDGNTIKGLTFYEHAETPGLGDGVEKPKWLNKWEGKLVYGPEGEPLIEVIRGTVDESGAAGKPLTEGHPAFQVDGMAGATLTGRGVTNLLHYWLGPHGYGPYLNRHWRKEETS
ncbi:MAG: Na(+)-translocating NADH-quinone reductase subunit C [Xanthomonadales bacterium]|nr:Na(+)-translocating NADH-quinone reductase subunit C [Xanthomonadales bacterium]